MTVDEFKNIYWYEYSHRMMGRLIGAFVAVPGLFFIIRRSVSPPVRNRILFLMGMVGCQGLLGWYMVKSGLDDKIIENREVPRVSQYRLAAHLACAFVIYMTAFTTGLSVLSRGTFVTSALSSSMKSSPMKSFKSFSHATLGMVFLTAVSGAFVAGLDAGLIYNTFPMMADRWIPSDLLALSPTWKNFFENATTVQFDHRLLVRSTTFT
jgi:heme a synthase